jgi:methylmalonyl-CoA/ethylmalonyl-CoA epimerase
MSLSSDEERSGAPPTGPSMPPLPAVPNIRQIALVVEDVDAAMEQYWTVLGIGPWDVRHFTPDSVRDFRIDGELVQEHFDFVCAVTWVGEVEFELIQPIAGPNIYWDFLRRRGPGLHHIKDVMSDAELPAALDSFAARGIRVMQTGWIDDDVHYYLDTEATLGLVYELGNGGRIGPPDRRYPPAAD